MTPTLKGRYEKGTFPEGYYWCRKLPGYGEPSIEIVGISNSYLPSHYEEILAPVPTFEEWQEMENQLKIAREALEELREIIATTSNQNAITKMPKAYKIINQALAQMDEVKGGVK